MLAFMVQQGVLQTSRQECLSPWLGPALRKAAATALQTRACLHSPQQRGWRHVADWRFQRGGTYDSTYEPPPLPQLHGLDHNSASRAVVLAPEIVPGDSTWDGSLAFEVLLMGEAAIAQRPALLSSLAAAGDLCDGDDEAVPFELVDLSPPVIGHLTAESLPAVPDSGEGLVERLTVRLNSPLFLDRLAVGQRCTGLPRPRFVDLFQAAQRSLQTLFARHDQPLDADTEALTLAAQQVTCESQSFVPFEQEGAAGHFQQECEMRGLLGTAVFRQVPWSLIPWMLWGGRFRVGQHRVCGAGGWSLELG